MQLMYAATSPFTRKVMIAAIELRLDARIERIASTASPVKANPALGAFNPLCKLPTLICDDGLTLFGSAVICEYLDAQASGLSILPAAGEERWQVLRAQALADGLLDAALLIRYELIRPDTLRWAPWENGQMSKIIAALDDIERLAEDFDIAPDIGQIAIACALGYLEFRFAALDWRAARPAASAWFATFEKRPSFAATRPA